MSLTKAFKFGDIIVYVKCNCLLYKNKYACVVSQSGKLCIALTILSSKGINNIQIIQKWWIPKNKQNKKKEVSLAMVSIFLQTIGNHSSLGAS